MKNNSRICFRLASDEKQKLFTIASKADCKPSRILRALINRTHENGILSLIES